MVCDIKYLLEWMKAIHPCLPSCLPDRLHLQTAQPGTALRRRLQGPGYTWGLHAPSPGCAAKVITGTWEGTTHPPGSALLQKEWFWCGSSAHAGPGAVCQGIRSHIALCTAGSCLQNPGCARGSRPRSVLLSKRGASPAISIHGNSFHLIPGREMKTRCSPQRGVPHGEPQLFNHFLAPPWQRAAPPPPRQETLLLKGSPRGMYFT